MGFDTPCDPRSSILDPQAISHTPILPHTHTSTMLPDLVLGDAFNGLAQHLEAHAFDKGFVADLRALLE